MTVLVVVAETLKLLVGSVSFFLLGVEAVNTVDQVDLVSSKIESEGFKVFTFDASSSI